MAWFNGSRLASMRVRILTLFLGLIGCAFAATLLFLRHKNFETVAHLSKGTMRLARDNIVKEVNNLFSSAQRLVETSAGLILSLDTIRSDNPWLRSYMLAAARSYPHMPYLLIGTETGNYLEVGNLLLSIQTHYISDPTKPLPKGTAYEWQHIEPVNGVRMQTTYYFNKEMTQLGSETFVQEKYDPRTRPWYIGPKEATRFFWTDVYTFYDTGDQGIAACHPLYDPEGRFIGALAADLSFELLSLFFSKHPVGKTGRACVLKPDGEIIVPNQKFLPLSPIPKGAVAAAFRNYTAPGSKEGAGGKPFLITHEGVRYLALVERFPIQTGAPWLIALLVPWNDFFAETEKTQQEALLIIAAISLLAAAIVAFFAKKLSDPLVVLSRSVDQVRELNFTDVEPIHTNIEEIANMDSSVSSMRTALTSFTRYVPKEIVKQLIAQNRPITLGGEKQNVTILFSDIEGFTPIIEELPPETFMPLLAAYFDGLSKLLIAGKGTIDKYIGDSIMAFWGAPLPLDNHPVHAAEAVLQCHAFVQRFNAERQRKKEPLFRTRFGLNTGSAIVGNIGTPERMNYTLMGDAVNAAARLQTINKLYHTSILISASVHAALPPQFISRPIDIAEVKGKKEKIPIYELLAKQDGPKEIAPSKTQLALAEQFTSAYTAFHTGDLPRAEQLFFALKKEFPNDYPTELYCERLNQKT
jgi:adenylate cyclase